MRRFRAVSVRARWIDRNAQRWYVEQYHLDTSGVRSDMDCMKALNDVADVAEVYVRERQTSQYSGTHAA